MASCATHLPRAPARCCARDGSSSAGQRPGGAALCCCNAGSAVAEPNVGAHAPTHPPSASSPACLPACLPAAACCGCVLQGAGPRPEPGHRRHRARPRLWWVGGQAWAAGRLGGGRGGLGVGTRGGRVVCGCGCGQRPDGQAGQVERGGSSSGRRLLAGGNTHRLTLPPSLPLPAGKLSVDYANTHANLKSSVTLTAAPKVDVAGARRRRQPGTRRAAPAPAAARLPHMLLPRLLPRLRRLRIGAAGLGSRAAAGRGSCV